MRTLCKGSLIKKTGRLLVHILSVEARAANLSIGIDGFSGGGNLTLSGALVHFDTRVAIDHMHDF